ncbi:hypothetical protein Bca4012_055343 [Brassica carinata]
MKHSKDPFEAAIEEEQEESPPDSPVSSGGGGGGSRNDEGLVEIDQTPEESERDVGVRRQNKKSKTSSVTAEGMRKDEDEEEEEENMEAELTKYPTTADPAKMATMQDILSQFTEDQMSRYESFRRSALQKGNMRKGVTGSQKISMPITIVTCGIAKMFVGELVETGKDWCKRVSPDCLPLTNEPKKPYSRPSPSNEVTTTSVAGRGFNGGSCTISSSLDGVPKGFRFRSNQQQDSSPNRGGGDVLLQWGQRKRSRVSRAEIRSTTADDSSSSSGQVTKSPVDLSCSSSIIIMSRNLEDRSANGSPSRHISSRMVSRSAGSKRSPPSPDQIEKRSSVRDHHQTHRQNGLDHNHNQQHQRVSRSESTAQTHPELETNNNNGEREKATQVETREWPRIYIALSRKEKEEDFLVMKGTKLPHRPRKRAKNIDKSLQYCFPGMWLSDLTKNRYEVREKKNVKKQPKRRGLKGLENLDTDSE